MMEYMFSEITYIKLKMLLCSSTDAQSGSGIRHGVDPRFLTSQPDHSSDNLRGDATFVWDARRPHSEDPLKTHESDSCVFCV
jgi:hypothetical protein